MDPVAEILRFHRPLDDDTFRKAVRELRDSAKDPNWLYKGVVQEQRGLWQGDVLPFAELPFVNNKGEIEVVEQRAMLLSTTCDAVPDQDPSAVLAPVYPMSAFAAGTSPQKRASELANLQSNRYARCMFLPAVGSFPDSYVNFSESASVSNSHLRSLEREAEPANRARFSRLGWYFFNYKLGYYYARAEDEAELPRGSELVWTM